MPYNEWDPDKTPWQKIDKEYMILIGNSAFYNIEYEIDLNNTKRYVLTVRYKHIMGIMLENFDLKKVSCCR